MDADDEWLVLASPRVRAVAAADNGESLVDARPLIATDAREHRRNPSLHLAREGVVERLTRAQSALPDGLRILLVEGFRRPSLQQRYFDDYCARLLQLRPDLPSADIELMASEFVAPPDVAPHSTGGAVDVTLVDSTGAELDMGTAVNDGPLESDLRCYTWSDRIPNHAKLNRRMLINAMAGAGFVNLVTEWWHWSYGEKLWAAVERRNAAVYDILQGPSRLQMLKDLVLWKMSAYGQVLRRR